MKWLILIMAYVCNLGIFESNSYASNASGPAVPDGSIYVSALDGDGFTIKYNLGSDFNYATGGQISPIFNDLVPGTYKVYARSNSTCLKTIEFVVEYVITYNPLYRLQFYDDRGNGQFHYRFDIEDNEFTGDVTELENFGPSPVVISWRGETNEDPDISIVSSETIVNLIAIEDGQFDDLVTGDERRFRGTLFLEVDGDWILKWQGFNVPQLAVQQYTQKENYYISLTFTDQLANLAKVPFSDDSGNTIEARISVFDAIKYCLHKTNIDLEIWETFNIRHYGMLPTMADSPLRQVFIDPMIYVSNGNVVDALTVLKSELSNIFCRVVQSDGRWQIDHIPFKAGTNVLTRKFAFDGSTLGSADEVYRIALRRGVIAGPRLAVAMRNTMKAIIPPYGELNLNFNLGIEDENNIMTVSDFEDQDIANGQLKGWQIDNTDAPFVTCEIEKVSTNGDSFNALKAPFLLTRGITQQQVLIIYSEPVKVSVLVESRIRFSFEALARMIQFVADKYAFLDYAIEIDNGTDIFRVGMDLGGIDGTSTIHGETAGAFDTFVDGVYNRIYIEKDNEWTKTTKEFILTQDRFDVDEVSIQIIFRVNCNPLYDNDGVITGAGGNPLEQESTFGATDYPTRNYNNRRRTRDIVAGNHFIRSYRLEAGTEAYDYPDVIVPDDNLTMIWKLDKTINSPQLFPLFYECWVKDFLLAKVVMEYLPDSKEPVPSINFDLILNKNNKLILTRDYRHGDIIGDSSIDENYKLISRGYYSLSDGSPTSSRWMRHPEPLTPGGGDPILKLMLNWFQGQNAQNRFKLSGMFDHDGALPSMNNTIYEVRSGIIFLPMAMTLHLRSRLFEAEVLEILRGQPQEDEGDVPDPEVEPPIDIREHTDEHTDEYD